MKDLGARLQAALVSREAQRLLRQAFKTMAEPPKTEDWQAAGARGWHMGACLVLAQGLKIWLQDERAELWGCGAWTEPAKRPAWDKNPERFYHRGYWDFVNHVVLASGNYLLDAGGVYLKSEPERVLAWWHEEYGPDMHGLRPLAGLKVSLEEEGIRRAPEVSAALAKLLERLAGSGVAWREELKRSSLTLARVGSTGVEFGG